jgi:hypothetical protein
MCQYCEQSRKDLAHANAHIASLLDAFATGSSAEWETSEPILIGGPPAQYECIPPFVGQCQWKVDLAITGAAASQFLISTTQMQTPIDYTGVATILSGYSGASAFAMNVPANSTLATYSEWYPMSNSDQLYILITSAADAAFVNLVFRQKRNTRKWRG